MYARRHSYFCIPKFGVTFLSSLSRHVILSIIKSHRLNAPKIKFVCLVNIIEISIFIFDDPPLHDQPVHPADGETLHDQPVHTADGETLRDQPNQSAVFRKSIKCISKIFQTIQITLNCIFGNLCNCISKILQTVQMTLNCIFGNLF